MNMKTRIGLFGFCALFSASLLAQPNFRKDITSKVESLCSRSLLRIQNDIDSLIFYYPDSLGLLQPGKIDSAKWSIQFKGPKISETISGEGHYPDYHYSGLSFEFVYPAVSSEEPIQVDYRFHFIKLAIRWNWSWPGRFSSPMQKIVMKVFDNALDSLKAFESHQIQAFLKRSPPPHNIHGHSGPDLQLEAVQGSENTWLVVVAMNNNDYPIYLSKMDHVLLINDRPMIRDLPKGLLKSIDLNRSNQCPFDFILPNQEMEITSLPITDILLSPGPNKIQLLATFSENRWVDRSQQIIDGPAINHVEEASWMGCVLSQAATFEITK